MLSACLFFAAPAANPLVAVPGEDDDPRAALRLTVPAATDESARQLLQVHNVARGGDALGKIKNWQGKGTLREGRNEYRIQDSALAPDKWRREKTERIRGREITVLEGFDGTTGWIMDMSRRNPLPERMDTEQARETALRADFFGPLVNWEAKPNVFTYLGEERSRGRDEYVLRMFYPDGLFVDFYLDRRNRLVTRISKREIMSGAIVNFDTHITRYERLQGVWMPMAMRFTLNGQPFGHLEYRELELNAEVDPAFFTIPQVEEVWLRQQGPQPGGAGSKSYR